jgi:hypothetical protein
MIDIKGIREYLIFEVIGSIFWFLLSTIFTVLNKYFFNQKILEILPIIFLLIGLVFIFIIVNKYRQIKLQYLNTGILNIFQQRRENNKNYSIMTKKLENANTIRVFLTTGLKFFTNNENAIEYAIKNNKAKVFVLIADKKARFLMDVNELERKGDERAEFKDIRDEIPAVENILNEITARTGNIKAIEIKHFHTEFRTSMILIEKDNEPGWGWITLTLPPAKAVNTISFEIESKNPKDDNIYNQCIRHFLAVWEKL